LQSWAHSLHGASGLDEGGLEWPQVTELEDRACAAVRRDAERDRTLRHGILELPPFIDDIVEVTVER
jgi:hypothetical protein